MKFSIQSKSLRDILSALDKVISAKNPISILSTVHVILRDGRLSLHGSNGELTLQALATAEEIEGEGTICLPAARLLSLFKSMGDTTATFIINPTSLNATIKTAFGKYDIKGEDGDSYPSIEADDLTAGFVLPPFQYPSQTVLNALNYVAFACDPGDLRPQMGGIYWNIFPEGIDFVASDTYTLALYTCRATATGTGGSFILPRAAVPVLQSLLVNEPVVTIAANDKRAVFQTPSFTLRAGLINGRYPNYRSVIPVNTLSVTINRQTLLGAIKRVSTCTDKVTQLLSLALDYDKLTINAKDVCFATSATETISVSYRDKPLRIGFSSARLLAVLGVLSTENIILKLQSPGHAALLLPAECDKDCELTELVMPINLGEDD